MTNTSTVTMVWTRNVWFLWITVCLTRDFGTCKSSKKMMQASRTLRLYPNCVASSDAQPAILNAIVHWTPYVRCPDKLLLYSIRFAQICNGYIDCPLNSEEVACQGVKKKNRDYFKDTAYAIDCASTNLDCVRKKLHLASGISVAITVKENKTYDY